MTRKMFVPMLPLYFDISKLQYKLDDRGKEIKFSSFGKQTARTVSKHKASGRYYQHPVNKSSKPSPIHSTQHDQVVSERARRSNMTIEEYKRKFCLL